MPSPGANRNGIVDRVLGYPYAPAALDGRRPVLAYGANASPAVLQHKLGGAAVPAAPLALRGWVAVYSAHVSPYGAIPATIVPAEGAIVAAARLWLTASELERLAATEPNYHLEELTAGLAFVSRHGPLRLDGAPVALDALSQRAVQDAVRALLAPHETLEQFIVANASDPERARRMTERLKALSAA